MNSADGSELIDSLLPQEESACHPFQDLPRKILKDFAAICYTSDYLKGVSLFVEGQSPRGLYLLRSGRVKLVTRSGKGEARIRRIAEPHEMLGLSATIAGVPYEATALSLTACRADFVSRKDFLYFLRQHPAACFRVVQLLGQYLQAAHGHFRLLSNAPSVACKLAALLLDWSAQKGVETGAGIRFEIPLTHRDLARLIGSRRETVTRTLGEFRRKHLLRLEGTTILIEDRAALEALLRVHGARQ